MRSRYEFEVDASAEQLFDWMHNYDLRAQRDTFTQSTLLDGAQAGVGGVVRSTSKNNGLSMDTMY